MTSLAPQADQAVRHAVDAYIDGRLLQTLEGDATFETRNSSYRLLDGVLFAAREQSLLGAEFVGWLVEYVTRAEVVSQWKAGARAVLVDTRNDGARGPHIVVTSSTRTYRAAHRPSQPSLRLTPPHPLAAYSPGSSLPHVGSLAAHGSGTLPPPPFPPVPSQHRPWNATSDHHVSDNHIRTAPATLPPPPPLPTFRARDPRSSAFEAMDPLRSAAHRIPGTFPPPPMVVSQSLRSLAPPPPLPRPLPRALPPQPPMFADEEAVRKVAAAYEASFLETGDDGDSAPTIRNEKPRHSTRNVGGFAPPVSTRNVGGFAPPVSTRTSHGRSAATRNVGASHPSAATRMGGFASPMNSARSSLAHPPLPPASVPFLLSRQTPGTRAPGHQRGLPLR